MPCRMLYAEDEAEAAAMEPARAMVRELVQLAEAAPDGRVPAAVGRVTVDRGRRFISDRLQDVLNAQADGLEEKGGAPGPAPVAAPGGATARHTGGPPPPPAT